MLSEDCCCKSAFAGAASRGRPDTDGPPGCVRTCAVTRTSPQSETSQITITPQITAAAAAAVILIFLGNFTCLLNGTLTPTAEVLDTIQRPTVAGMRPSEHVAAFGVCLVLSRVGRSLNGAAEHRRSAPNGSSLQTEAQRQQWLHVQSRSNMTTFPFCPRFIGP